MFVGAARRRTGASGVERRVLRRAAPSNSRSSVTPSGRLRRPVLASPPPTTTGGTWQFTVGRQVRSVRDDAQLAPVGLM